MPGMQPQPKDLPELLARKLERIELQLAQLARPDGTQKAMLVDQMDEANAKIAAQAKQIESQAKQIESLNNSIKGQGDAITKYRTWLDDHQRQLNAHVAAINAIRDAVNRNGATLGQVRDALNKLTTRVNALDKQQAGTVGGALGDVVLDPNWPPVPPNWA